MIAVSPILRQNVTASSNRGAIVCNKVFVIATDQLILLLLVSDEIVLQLPVMLFLLIVGLVALILVPLNHFYPNFKTKGFE